MPYVYEDGELKFVTQAEIEAYNQANPVSGVLTARPSLPDPARQTTPAGGSILNITPQNPNYIQLQTPQGTLLFPDQQTLEAWQNNPQSVSVAQAPQGQIVQEILIPNTNSTSPEQSLPEEYQAYSSPITVPPEAVPEVPQEEEGLIRLNDGANLGVPDEFGFVQDSTGLNVLPEDQEPGQPDGYLTEFTPEGENVLNPDEVTAAQVQAENEFGARQQARQQQAIASQRRQVNNQDWRVRLRLAPQAKYLYNAPNPGILAPLQVTDGIIFPYTPQITTAYKADYDPYTLTHSNYKGYFYKGSYVDAININATFTAQNTADANYLLAVITFLKSVTKMFYGQDAERGAPPPLTYLSGLGEYQFNEHPCLISQFNFNLPADVDYIRAGSPNQLGTNLVNQRPRQEVTTGSLFGGLNRLAAALLTKGALPNPPSPPSLGLARPTYVPTKMEIQLTLLPIQSRQQVSKQFSVKEFANGNLIKGGFW